MALAALRSLPLVESIAAGYCSGHVKIKDVTIQGVAMVHGERAVFLKFFLFFVELLKFSIITFSVW